MEKQRIIFFHMAKRARAYRPKLNGNKSRRWVYGGAIYLVRRVLMECQQAVSLFRAKRLFAIGVSRLR